jgi:type III secretory pathway component EscT
MLNCLLVIFQICPLKIHTPKLLSNTCAAVFVLSKQKNVYKVCVSLAANSYKVENIFFSKFTFEFLNE